MAKKGLVKMKYYYNKAGNYYTEIEDMNIYYDSIEGQFKHKFICKCDKEIGCFCFDTMEDAVDGVLIGLGCNTCVAQDFISDCLYEDETLQELIDVHEGTNIRILMKLRNEADNGGLFHTASDEFRLNVVGAAEDELDHLIFGGKLATLSDRTTKMIVQHAVDVDYFDCGFGGSSCNV